MSGLPRGTVTFLFTDVEGSTRLLHELGDGYAAVLVEHRRVLREVFAGMVVLRWTRKAMRSLLRSPGRVTHSRRRGTVRWRSPTGRFAFGWASTRASRC